jgi:hypothetical protein
MSAVEDALYESFFGRFSPRSFVGKLTAASASRERKPELEHSSGKRHRKTGVIR